MFKLDTILTLAKSMTTKAVKAEGGAEITTCEVKFSGMPIQREHVDPILGMPFGWAELALFDEQGAPLAHLSITSHRTQLRVTGTVSGPKGDPTLKFMQASLSDQEVGLCNVGGIVAGKLTWNARGDEIEDIAELLGKLCRAELTVSDGEQDDLFAKQRKMTEASTSHVLAMLEKMRHTPRAPQEDPPQPAQGGEAA
jgi:hypothetical protein